MRVQPGFTAVEVLVTLIIAFLLVAGSYQAYGLVVQNSDEANSRGIASSKVYETLRKEVATVGSSCSVSYRDSYNETALGITLPNAHLSTRLTCPYGSGSQKMTLVTTTLEYGDSKEVSHAILTIGN